MVLRHQREMNTGRHVMPGCVGIGSKILAIGFFYQPIDGSFTKFFRECKLLKNPCRYVLRKGLGHLHGCFQKSWYPQIIHFNRVFHCKPSILGYPYFWKHPHSYSFRMGLQPKKSYSREGSGFLGIICTIIKWFVSRFPQYTPQNSPTFS